ncbi:MAG TPA: hypothetical protein VMC79_02115, partial [Rectinemataceae bacterium]|nr:hypothetical protein [Rectinemataceae bacterium]
VLTIQVKGSRDIIAAYNFFEVAGGTKIIANMINVPSGAAGDAVVGAVEESLAGFKQHFGGTKEAEAAPQRASASSSVSAESKKPGSKAAPSKGRDMVAAKAPASKRRATPAAKAPAAKAPASKVRAAQPAKAPPAKAPASKGSQSRAKSGAQGGGPKAPARPATRPARK